MRVSMDARKACVFTEGGGAVRVGYAPAGPVGTVRLWQFVRRDTDDKPGLGAAPISRAWVRPRPGCGPDSDKRPERGSSC
jgi:hypothetical protein